MPIVNRFSNHIFLKWRLTGRRISCRARTPNLPRVFITLNHKALQKPNTSSLICQFNPREVAPPADPPAINLPRVFLTLNHKSHQKSNTSSLTCPTNPREVAPELTSRGFLSHLITNHTRNPIPHPLFVNSTRGRLHPPLIHRQLSSRGFLSPSITKHSRNPIPHVLIARPTRQEFNAHRTSRGFKKKTEAAKWILLKLIDLWRTSHETRGRLVRNPREVASHPRSSEWSRGL